VETDKVPCRDAGGAITGIIGFAVDITDRRESEGELRRKQAEVQALFESFPRGAGAVGGKPPHKVLAHNKYYQELFRRTLPEAREWLG